MNRRYSTVPVYTFSVEEYNEIDADRIKQDCKLSPLQVAMEGATDALIEALANSNDKEAGRMVREILAEHLDFELWRLHAHNIPSRKTA